jgi:hypothetical protein
MLLTAVTASNVAGEGQRFEVAFPNVGRRHALAYDLD